VVFWERMVLWWTGLLCAVSVFAVSAVFVNPEITPKLDASLILVFAGGAIAGIRACFLKVDRGVGLISVLLLLTFLYVLLHTALLFPSGLLTLLPMVAAILIFGYGYFQPSDSAVFRNMGLFLAWLCLIQALYGLVPQLMNLWSGGGLVRIRGSFDNPAGFAVTLSMLFPWCVARWFRGKLFSKVLWAVASVVVALAVGASGSRAGLLCLLMVGFGMPLVHFFGHKWRVLRRLLLLSPIVLLLLLGGLYLLRPSSVEGRLLIWTGTLEMLRDHGLTGSGPLGFQSHYMVYQAEWLEQHPDSQWSELADNVRHPFNEYLWLGVGFGAPALLLLLGMVLVLAGVLRARAPEVCAPALWGLLVLAVFSMFSYPFRYAGTWVFAAWFLAEAARGEPIRWQVPAGARWVWAPLLILVCALLFSVTLRQMQAHIQWGRVARQALSGEQDILPEYHRLSKVLGHHPHFLFNYASELHHAGQYTQSVRVARACAQGLNDLDVQMLLAMNYMALGQRDSARASFVLASQMCPNRLAPLVGLMRLYDQAGNQAEAEAMAQTILRKPIKIRSVPVLILQEEARAYLRRSSE